MGQGYAFDIPCQRRDCQGTVKGEVFLQPAEWNDYIDPPEQFQCDTCHHSYTAAFIVQHKEECTDPETGAVLDDDTL